MDRTGNTRTGYTGPNTVATRNYTGTTANRYNGYGGNTGVGYTGWTGYTPGMTGYTGNNGYNGYTGYTGYTSPPGAIGYMGYNRYTAPGLTGYDNALNGAQNMNPNYRPTNLNADADRMADLAATVRGVDSAKSIIVGRTAYVGLDIAENLPNRTAPAIETEVYRVLSRAMPSYDIRVTSDKGFLRRIGFIDTGLRNTGYDYNRYRSDLDYLNRNMVPNTTTRPAR